VGVHFPKRYHQSEFFIAILRVLWIFRVEDFDGGCDVAFAIGENGDEPGDFLLFLAQKADVFAGFSTARPEDAVFGAIRVVMEL